MTSSRRVSVAICAVGGLAAASLVVLLVWNGRSTAALGAEGYKAALQFLFVVILGGAVSLLYQAFNREADQRAKRREELDEHRRALRGQRQTFAAAFVDDYNVVKKARRLMRARAVDRVAGTDTVRLRDYDSIMRDVVEVQLRLETTRRALGPGDPLFPKSEEIAAEIAQMDSYLGGLITEYERRLPEFRAVGSPPRLTDLPELRSFLAPYRRSPEFGSQFVRPFHAALAMLRESATEHIDGVDPQDGNSRASV